MKIDRDIPASRTGMHYIHVQHNANVTTNRIKTGKVMDKNQKQFDRKAPYKLGSVIEISLKARVCN